MRSAACHAIWLFVVLAVPVGEAAQFGSLVPGKTDRLDAEGLLGRPMTTLEKGRRYAYRGAALRMAKIVITYNADTSVVDALALHPLAPVTREQALSAFGLKTLQKAQAGEQLVELYSDQQVALKYGGRQSSTPVVCVTLYSPSAYEAATTGASEGDRSRVSTGAPEVKVWIGVSTRFVENKESPEDFAQQKLPPRQGVKVVEITDQAAPAAGKLLKDAIIYRVNGQPVTSPKGFSGMVARLPIGREALFTVFVSGEHRDVRLAPVKYPEWLLLFGQGKAQHNSKQHEEAVESFSNAMQLNPSHLGLHIFRGFAYESLNQLEKALADWSRAVEIDPKHHWPHLLRGNYYFKARQYGRAIENYDAALRISPRYSAALGNRGLCYLNLKQYDLAVRDFSEAIPLSPRYGKHYANRGRAYQKLGRHQEAVKDFTKLIDLDSSSTDGYRRRGAAYGDLGDYDVAIRDYDQAIRIAPKDKTLYNERGWAYARKGDYARATRDYNKALEFDPNWAWMYSRLGLAHRAMGEPNLAINDLKRALTVDPSYIAAHFNLGLVYKDLDQFDQAIESFGHAVRLNPDYKEAWYQRGYCYIKQAKNDRAVEHFNRALSIDPKYAQAYQERAYAYDNMGQKDRAREDYLMAFNLNPVFRFEVSPRKAMAGTSVNWVVEYPSSPVEKIAIQEKWMLLREGKPIMWGEKKTKFVLAPGQSVHKVPYKIPGRMEPGQYTLRLRVSLFSWNLLKRPEEHERTATLDVTK